MEQPKFSDGERKVEPYEEIKSPQDFDILFNMISNLEFVLSSVSAHTYQKRIRNKYHEIETFSKCMLRSWKKFWRRSMFYVLILAVNMVR